MPTPTYVALAKTVLTGSQTSISFSSIPSTYTDLLILVSARTDRVSSVGTLKIRFNGASTDTNLTSRYMYGGDSSVTNSTDSFANLGYISGSTTTANTFGSVEVYIPNYAGNTNKPISSTSVSENNLATSAYIQPSADLFNSSAVISSIEILLNTANNFVSGSRFDLYGIKNS